MELNWDMFYCNSQKHTTTLQAWIIQRVEQGWEEGSRGKGEYGDRKMDEWVMVMALDADTRYKLRRFKEMMMKCGSGTHINGHRVWLTAGLYHRSQALLVIG